MKLLKHDAIKKGGAKVLIEAEWSNHLRQPAVVSIEYGPASDAGPKKLIEGDTKQVTDVLFAIAETAWSMGWRPRGLAGTLAQVCTSFKIPPPE
tara:strand:- start:1466 stop:1747 length:282 start_codon:yes stop_codon:yes gene_type:complete